MSVRKAATSTCLENAPYPRLQVLWEEDEDRNGWSGRAVIWKSPNEHDSKEHTISLRQGIPLGKIFLIVDECGHGCWASTSFEGVNLTERDLQWAAAYASMSIKHQNHALSI